MPSSTVVGPKKSIDKHLYDHEDEAELLAIAKKTLLSYGTGFFPSVITRAQGVYIYTADGRQILDWTSGQMSCLLGHGNEEIVETIHEHAKHLDHLFSGMISPPVIRLAKQLTDLTPPGLDKAFFLSTGSESNEAAIKLAKLYTGKFEMVGLSASWHGMTASAVGAQYHVGRKGYGPVVSHNSYPSVII
jgi:4-aminobutyrate aminotransferase-like enzyme